MDEDRQVLSAAVRWLEDGEQVALATVVETWGSSPRPLGSHMAVRVDGRFVGSVSGGCIENAVVSEAVAAIDAGGAKLLDFGISAWKNGLSCGGRIAVLVHAVHDPEPFRRVLARRGQGLASAVEIGLADGSIAFRPELSSSRSVRGERSLLRGYAPPPRLAIAGAVHIAEYLAPMARMTGFHVDVFDPRREFARRGTFDGDPIIAWPDGYFADHPIDPRTAVLSLTHTAKIDHPTMRVALNSPAFYVGALGSRKTHAARLRRLADEGFSEACLARMHGPVGLAIGARSPAEIAVSILAELVREWRRLESVGQSDHQLAALGDDAAAPARVV